MSFFQSSVSANQAVIGILQSVSAVGDQAVNNSFLVSALRLFQSAANRLSYNVALLAGLPISDDHVLPVKRFGTVGSNTDPLGFAKLNVAQSQTDFESAVSALNHLSSVASLARVFGTLVPAARRALQVAAGDISSLTSLPAPVAAPGSNQMEAVHGVRGGLGYLDDGLSSYLFGYMAGQANISAALAAVNRAMILHGYQNQALGAAVGIFPADQGKDAALELAPVQWNFLLDDTLLLTEDVAKNVYFTNHRFIDSWRRTDLGGYWLSEL